MQFLKDGGSFLSQYIKQTTCGTRCYHYDLQGLPWVSGPPFVSFPPPMPWTWLFGATTDAPGVSGAAVKGSTNCDLPCFASAPATTIVGAEAKFTDGGLGATCYSNHTVWNFGDGSQVSGSTTTHTYATPGTYRWSMTSGTCSKAGSIDVRPPTLACSAAVPSRADVLSPITLTSHVNNGGTGWATVKWTFGDLEEGTGVVTRHAYRKPGTYHWSMTASQMGAVCTSSGTTVVGYPDLGSDLVFITQSATGALVYGTSISMAESRWKDVLVSVLITALTDGALALAGGPLTLPEALLHAAVTAAEVLHDVAELYDPISVTPVRANMTFGNGVVTSQLSPTDRHIGSVIYIDLIKTKVVNPALFSSGLSLSLYSGIVPENNVEVLSQQEMQALDPRNDPAGSATRSFLIIPAKIFDAAAINGSCLFCTTTRPLTMQAAVGYGKGSFGQKVTLTSSVPAARLASTFTVSPGQSQTIKPHAVHASTLVVAVADPAGTAVPATCATVARIYSPSGFRIYEQAFTDPGVYDIDVTQAPEGWYFVILSNCERHVDTYVDDPVARRRAAVH